MKTWQWGLAIFAVACLLGAYNSNSDQPVVMTAAKTDLHMGSPSSLVDGLPGYDTIEEAGIAGIARAYKCSQYYECGGVIAKRDSDGKYVVGPAQSNSAGDHVEITHRVPEGAVMVGDYHTHPCLPTSHFVPYFSNNDTSINTMVHVVGFMGDLCTGEVHMFNPFTMRADTEKLDDSGDTIYLTKGVIVGKIEVSGLSVEPATGFN